VRYIDNLFYTVIPTNALMLNVFVLRYLLATCFDGWHGHHRGNGRY